MLSREYLRLLVPLCIVFAGAVSNRHPSLPSPLPPPPDLPTERQCSFVTRPESPILVHRALPRSPRETSLGQIWAGAAAVPSRPIVASMSVLYAVLLPAPCLSSMASRLVSVALCGRCSGRAGMQALWGSS